MTDNGHHPGTTTVGMPGMTTTRGTGTILIIMDGTHPGTTDIIVPGAMDGTDIEDAIGMEAEGTMLHAPFAGLPILQDVPSEDVLLRQAAPSVQEAVRIIRRLAQAAAVDHSVVVAVVAASAVDAQLLADARLEVAGRMNRQ